MARPEDTLKYRFLQATNENGESVKADSSYSQCATEVDRLYSF